MKQRPSRYAVAIISLLVFLLTGQAGVQGYVWCLGEDGHATLESTMEGPCGLTADCHGARAAGLARQDEDCGRCLDLPSSAEATSGRFRNQQHLPMPASLPAAAARPAVFPALCRLPARVAPQPPPRVSQTLLAQRTVVLLN